ncbi:probable LRR receptor-like serine/threonine-protein kinase At1g51820 isoform X1 [Primulina eburnea]|uniref:probable LRR receptor-like serine/threonine-protein kinase At1g51820 isoform X1 n=1 Tax=Primulina eburnea TaxID=1245227 RepID=UPI003C6BFEB3
MAAAPPLISVLILSLCTLFTLTIADVFASIDCGSSVPYTDENTIVWSGDDDYIKTGESRTVQSNGSISHVMSTLRVFTDRKKNCYNIGNIKIGRILVRASFYYGNYDGKSSAPSFDLQFDGNHWTTVKTSSTEYVTHEVIYGMRKNIISVCVAQTNDDEFPFISALEVRSLDSYMYQFINGTYPLFLLKRVAYAANSTIRFKNDRYDRIWTPESGGLGDTKLFGNSVISNPGWLDNPPPVVLRNAVAPIDPNATLVLDMGFPPVVSSVYINWFFSEVTQLQPGQNRTFRIHLNESDISDPISPIFGNFTQVYASNYTTSPNSKVSLVPTNYSTLPPLINAMEVYLIGEMTTNGTNVVDMIGLTSLQKSFDILQSWSGDPCLPSSYPWDWVNCSSGSVPRVTALFLGSFGLSGLLPNFSSMDRLETIDLQNNSLTGPIPAFLGTFPNLKELNLANNKFDGSIPPSLSQKKGLNLVVVGNSGLCQSGKVCPTSGSNSWRQGYNSLPIILSIAILSLICIMDTRLC